MPELFRVTIFFCLIIYASLYTFSFPLAETMITAKKRIARLLYNMVGQLPSGLKMTVKNLVAEDDNVAMEVESYGELQNGRVYDQQYHFFLTVREGRINAIKEYLDTQHVYATWFEK